MGFAIILEEMNALAPKKFAVIGCNVSARMAVNALVARFPQAQVKWLPAPKDPPLDEQTETGLCLPEQLFPALGDAQKSPDELFEWHFHFNRHEHELLRDFASEHPRRRSSAQIPRALRAKIESVGLWSDLTPLPWTAEQGVAWNWTRENPASLAERKSEKWALYSRKALLQDPHLDPRLRVLGLENGETKDTTKIIYNAPFGSETFDAILWTSHGSRLRGENETSFNLKPLSKVSQARWKTWTASVPLKSVAFLPPASLWLDAGDAGRYFLEHGLFRSGSLHRVLRLPAASDGAHCVLQIETLEFFSDPLPTGARVRPDAMLWDFCPFLKTAAIPKWREQAPDENLIYADPFPILHRYARGIGFWSGGAFSNLPRLLEMNAVWPHINLAPPV